jgi:hypothetical protein
MGMYDYVGYDGEQVKCFYVPCINVKYNKETKESVVGFGVSGGRLICQNDATYMTHYYNYGKDFAVIEYRLMPREENPYVHIFRDGKFVETVAINNMSDDYKLPYNVIDHYGEWTNIHTPRDLREFVKDYHHYNELYKSMEAEALEHVGLSYKLPGFNEMKQKSSDAIQYECMMRNQIGHEVYNQTCKIFNERWYDNSRESPLDIIGLIIDDYIDVHADHSSDDDWRKPWRHEYEWYIIFKEAIETLKGEYSEPVEAYYAWAQRQGIEVDRDWIYELFCKYVVPAHEELVKSYEEYLDNRGW